MINCSFNEMKQYYFYNIDKLNFNDNKIKFGFYCNKINELEYSNYKGDKKTILILEIFIIMNK